MQISRKPTKLDKQIGEQVEVQRKIKRKNREWLAAKLGLSSQQIQNYEVGRQRIQASRLWQISKALCVEIKEFFPK